MHDPVLERVPRLLREYRKLSEFAIDAGPANTPST
jgi:hypothetical protein